MSAHLDCKTNKKSLYFQMFSMKNYIVYTHLLFALKKTADNKCL